MNVKISSILLLTALMFGGCKKYEDGPGLSLRSKKERVAADWNVVEEKYDGEVYENQPYTDSAYCSIDDTYKKYEVSTIGRMEMEFTKEGTIQWISQWERRDLDYSKFNDDCEIHYRITYDSFIQEGTWEFSSNKEKLKVVLMEIEGDFEYEFDIIELREKRMKLKAVIEEDLIELTLEKISN
jgi:hypothetical protein